MNNYALAFLMVLVGMIILFAVNNFTSAGAYGFISCTFNQHCCEGCDDTGWDGVCTAEMKSLCCDPVRICEGFTTVNPMDCYDRYCWADGNDCVPGEQLVGDEYTCKCYDYESDIPI